jgi:hypothetical protein
VVHRTLRDLHVLAHLAGFCGLLGDRLLPLLALRVLEAVARDQPVVRNAFSVLGNSSVVTITVCLPSVDRITW